MVAYRTGGGVDETDSSVLKDWGLTLSLALCQCEILEGGVDAPVCMPTSKMDACCHTGVIGSCTSLWYGH